MLVPLTKRTFVQRNKVVMLVSHKRTETMLEWQMCRMSP